MSWNDLHSHVDEALEALPDKLKAPLIAHFLERQTHAAVAESLGIPRQTATNRIQRGIEEVRKQLKKRGVLVPAAALFVFLRDGTAQAAPAHLVSALGKGAMAGSLPGIVDATLLPAAPVTATVTALKWAAAMLLASVVAGGGVWVYRAWDAPRPPVRGQAVTQPAATGTPPAVEQGQSAPPQPVQPSTAPSTNGRTDENGIRNIILHRSR